MSTLAIVLCKSNDDAKFAVQVILDSTNGWGWKYAWIEPSAPNPSPQLSNVNAEIKIVTGAGAARQILDRTSANLPQPFDPPFWVVTAVSQ